MGYTTKEEFMEKINRSETLTDNDKVFIDGAIEVHRELGGDIVLKLGTINEMENKGILRAFYAICRANNFFPQWIYNVENGIDYV